MERNKGLIEANENYLTDPRTEPDSTKWQTELAFRLSDDQRWVEKRKLTTDD
jgi:hypothetical protein